MKQTMTQIGSRMWKGIRERVESWVFRPFQYLQTAFISEHEEQLLAKVVELEKENTDLKMQLVTVHEQKQQEDVAKQVYEDMQQITLEEVPRC